LLVQGYVIESGVTGRVGNINAHFDDKESALRALLKASGPMALTYRKDDSGTYVISPKVVSTTDTAPAPPVDTGVGVDTSAELPPAEKRIEKIKLTFADPAEISSFFGVDSGSNNSRFGSLGGGMGVGYGGMMGGGMMGGGMMGGGYGGGMGGGYGGGMMGGGSQIGGGYGGYRTQGY
jgi:hypothetical protein